MKRFAVALALACALSGTTLAGNIPTSDIVEPGETHTPPSVTAPGEIPSTGVSILLTILDLAF